jgi:hypothetical protein
MKINKYKKSGSGSWSCSGSWSGSWDNKEWKDAQRLPTDRLILSLGSVECIFEVKH